MHATAPQTNLAARMGRWSADHWKTATFGWLAFVLVAFALGGQPARRPIDPNTAGPRRVGPHGQDPRRGLQAARPAESVLIQSRTLCDDRPRLHGRGRRRRRAALEARRRPERPSPHRRQVSDRGRARGARRVRDPRRSRQGGGQDRPGSRPGRRRRSRRTRSSSSASSATPARSTRSRRPYGNDLGKAGLLSLPITLVILVIAFGALVAAGHPAAARADGRLRDVRRLVAHRATCCRWRNEAAALVLLIGLAVGVDYSIFYLKREREERAAGRSERAALEAAAATSGRSVLVSGLTVMAAMAGMFLTGDRVFASFAVATIAVVAIAVIGSLTVLPALLSRLGDRVDRGRVPLVGRLRRDDGEGRIWGAIIDRVLRRPAALGRARRRAARRARDPGAADAAWSSRAPTRSRSRSPSCRRTTGCSRRSPARRSRPASSSRLRT